MAIDTTEASLYGTGRGSAYVWGGNKALEGLQLAYQNDQLRKQKEDAELSDQLSKINYDAARNEDLPEIMKHYNGIKNTFTQLRGTQDQMERLKLQAKMSEQKAELSRAVNISKQSAQQLSDLGKLRITNADELSDDFVPNYLNLSRLSSFDPKFADSANNLTSTALIPKFDINAYSKNLADRSIDNVTGPVEDKKFGNSIYQEQLQGKRLNPDNLLNNAIKAYKEDRGFRKLIDREYKGVPVDEAIKTYAAETYHGYKDAYDDVKPKQLRASPKDLFYEHYNYELQHPKQPLFNVAPRDMNIPYGENGKSVVNIQQYVPISIPDKNFAGSDYIDMKTGKPSGKLSSSSDYQTVGVGNVPVIKRGYGGKLSGSIAQPNYAKNNPDAVEYKPMVHVQVKASDKFMDAENYLVPLSTAPVNVMQSKSIASALAGFKASSPQVKPTEQSKVSNNLKGKKYGGIDNNGNVIWK